MPSQRTIRWPQVALLLGVVLRLPLAGVTGSGFQLAIIDGQLRLDHEEYRDDLAVARNDASPGAQPVRVVSVSIGWRGAGRAIVDAALERRAEHDRARTATSRATRQRIAAPSQGHVTELASLLAAGASEQPRGVRLVDPVGVVALTQER